METSMTILFSVRKSKMNRNNQLPIYMRVTVAGGRFEVATGRSIGADKWIATAGKAKGTSVEARELNGFLDSLTGKAHGIQREILQEGGSLAIMPSKPKLEN